MESPETGTKPAVCWPSSEPWSKANRTKFTSQLQQLGLPAHSEVLWNQPSHHSRDNYHLFWVPRLLTHFPKALSFTAWHRDPKLFPPSTHLVLSQEPYNIGRVAWFCQSRGNPCIGWHNTRADQPWGHPAWGSIMQVLRWSQAPDRD